MNISAEGNFSVATLKEKFARAGQGKENATVLVGKKHIIDDASEQEKNNGKVEEEEEPMLIENKKRFVLFPIKYHEVRLRNTHD
jgi:ribonucleoside-diphosphate reductase subunit M2